MSKHTFEKVRRNLLSSLGVAISIFLVTTVINLVLIGWMGRNGGLELIGRWTLVITVMSFTYLIDFGFRDSLTRSITTDGGKRALPMVFSLFKWLFATAVPASLLCAILALLFPKQLPFFEVGLMAVWAGLLQISSGWLISLRLGCHEQYWFYLKTLVRVLIQAGSIPLLFQVMDPLYAFGLAVLLGALAEVVLSVLATWRDLRGWFVNRPAQKPHFREVWILAHGFGPANVMQGLQEPVLRVLLARFGGAELLGAFTVAAKLPQTASAAISESMRPLLPGLSALSKDATSSDGDHLLSQSLFLQIALGIPLSIFLWFNSAEIIEIWLNYTDESLVLVTRIAILGYAATNLTVPFFWTMQAFGQARMIAILTSINIAIIVVFCGLVYTVLDGELWHYAAVVTLSQTIFALSAHWYCQLRWHITLKTYSGVNWFNVFFLVVPMLAVNFSVSLWDNDTLAHLGSASAASVFAFGCGCAVVLAKSLKRKKAKLK